MAAMNSPANAGWEFCGGSVGGTVGGNNGYASGGAVYDSGKCGYGGQAYGGQPYYGNTFQHGGVPEWNADPYYRVPTPYQPNVGCGVGVPCSKGAAGRPVGLLDMRNGH